MRTTILASQEGQLWVQEEEYHRDALPWRLPRSHEREAPTQPGLGGRGDTMLQAASVPPPLPEMASCCS